MTFQEALTAQIGDRLTAIRKLHPYCLEGDDVILVERARDYNEITNDTGGLFFHQLTKTLFQANIQSFYFKK